MNEEEISESIFKGAKALINTKLQYLSGRNFFTPTSVEDARLRGIKEGADPDVSISKAIVDKYARFLAEGVPVHVESALEGSGNQRSALESLVSHLPNAGYILDGGVPNRPGKHILWCKDHIHAIGDRLDISTNWRDFCQEFTQRTQSEMLPPTIGSEIKFGKKSISSFLEYASKKGYEIE